MADRVARQSVPDSCALRAVQSETSPRLWLRHSQFGEPTDERDDGRTPRGLMDSAEAMNIELEIEGVSDRAVTGAIRKRVRTLGQHIDRSDDWRVRLVPSETRAEWDLGIRTASGWHIASFTAPPQRLADIVEQRLRVQLAAEAPAGKQ